ncbi:hypothetical protein CBM2629_B90093 [Cupriavidus taiwanensis]|nr:hypothetical protein CBM2629_B90093 [Cupriavidus taiwanensis]
MRRTAYRQERSIRLSNINQPCLFRPCSGQLSPGNIKRTRDFEVTRRDADRLIAACLKSLKEPISQILDHLWQSIGTSDITQGLL